MVWVPFSVIGTLDASTLQSSSIRLDLYGHIKIRYKSESCLLWVFILVDTTVPVF